MIDHFEHVFWGRREDGHRERSLVSMTEEEAALILAITWSLNDPKANEWEPIAIPLQALRWDDEPYWDHWVEKAVDLEGFDCRFWLEERATEPHWPLIARAALDISLTALQPEVRAALREGRIIADPRERALLILLYTDSTSAEKVCKNGLIAAAYGFGSGVTRRWLKRLTDAAEATATRGAGSGFYLTAEGVTAARALQERYEETAGEPLLARLRVYDGAGLSELRRQRTADPD